MIVAAWVPVSSAGAVTEGSITGRVTDTNGQPVGPGSGICALVGASSGSFSNLEADGTYRIDGIPPGSWAVRFVHCGQPRAPWPLYAPEYYPNLHDPAASASTALPNITVAAGATVTGIDAALEAAGTIRLTVRDAEGTPREGVCVRAEYRGRIALRSNVGVFPTQHHATSDASGVATLTGVSPGDFYFRAGICPDSPFTHPDLPRWQYSGDAFDATDATTIPVALSATVDAELVMQPGASVVGRVTRAGDGVSGTCVQWSTMGSNRSDHAELSTTADADGYYELRGIPPTVPGVVMACPPRTDNAVAPLWLPDAASRWTADTLTLAPGSARTWNADLLDRQTVSAIITSLPSAAGCRLRVDGLHGTRLGSLRSTAHPGVWAADAFAIDRDATAQLECGGRIVGKAKPADLHTPGFHPGWTENETSPVVQIVADLAGPTITPVGIPGNWTRTAARVSFTCSDPVAGVSSCPAAVTFAEGQQHTVTATDKYGNTTRQTLGPLKVDQTPPKITVSSPRRSFRRDETISLGCSIADARSGLRSKTVTCPANGTPASRLGPGDHTFKISGTDHAGNTASTTVRITIVK